MVSKFNIYTVHLCFAAACIPSMCIQHVLVLATAVMMTFIVLRFMDSVWTSLGKHIAPHSSVPYHIAMLLQLQYKVYMYHTQNDKRLVI